MSCSVIKPLHCPKQFQWFPKKGPQRTCLILHIVRTQRKIGSYTRLICSSYSVRHTLSEAHTAIGCQALGFKAVRRSLAPCPPSLLKSIPSCYTDSLFDFLVQAECTPALREKIILFHPVQLSYMGRTTFFSEYLSIIQKLVREFLLVRLSVLILMTGFL